MWPCFNKGRSRNRDRIDKADGMRMRVVYIGEITKVRKGSSSESHSKGGRE